MAKKQKSVVKKKPDKSIKKVIAGETKLKESKKVQRLVAVRNVDKMIKAGWKVGKDIKDAKGKVLNVNTHASDLVLMER